MVFKKKDKKSTSDKKAAKSADVVEFVPTEASKKIDKPKTEKKAKKADPAPLAPPPAAPAAGDKKLRDLCKELGITNVELAGMISVSPDVVELWKTKSNAPKSVIDMLQKQADFNKQKK